jgi:hypothetical protein
VEVHLLLLQPLEINPVQAEVVALLFWAEVLLEGLQWGQVLLAVNMVVVVVEGIETHAKRVVAWQVVQVLQVL